MKAKGADTKRVDSIDLRLSELQSELIFIENNRDKVAEYNKRQKELFDKEGEFKTSKTLLDKKLENRGGKHQQQIENFAQQIDIYRSEIEALSKTLENFKADLAAFENFTKIETYQSVENFISNFTENHKTRQNCVSLFPNFKLQILQL